MMRRFLLLGVAFPVLLAGQESSAMSEIALTELRFLNVGVDGAVFGSRAMIRARERVLIQRITFRNVTLAGAPVFLESFQDKCELPAGVLTPLPGELKISAYFRDANPEVVERLLEAGELKLEGTVEVQAELTFFQSVVTLRKSVITAVPFSGSVRIAFPGGEIGRGAALLAVRAAKPLWPTLSTAATAGLSSLPPDRAPTPDLALVVSTYRMRDKNGEIHEFDFSCTGFRISRTELAVPKEAIRPWEFNPEAMALEVNRKARLTLEGTDVHVFFDGERVEGSPATPLNGHRLSTRELVLAREGTADKEFLLVLDGPKRVKAEIHKRQSLQNFAILSLQSPGESASYARYSESENAYWNRLIAFRPRVAANNEVHFERIAVDAHRNGAELILETPVDHSSFGSPLVRNGIVGIVEDERSGFLVREIFAANGYSLPNNTSASER